MKIALQIFALILVTVSCTDYNKRSKTEKRILYVFNLDSLKRTENYQLEIEFRDSLIKYHYRNQADNERNITVRYNPNSKMLYLSSMEFEMTEKSKYSNHLLSDKKFDLFELKASVVDGNGPILFNQAYGLLSVDNGWGMRFMHLSQEEKPDLAMRIISNLSQ